ncbi:MAG: SDR family oxidoreductase [Gammaproteobacteria bacterium]|nr:SDR family oxidoreductase [Gammaproteobacteria bacterium]MYD80383.1 SDR family oxidoreductase [Gammaproteobacteria bacterium]
MDIKNRKAIVLGGTSGIGLAATRQLEDAGATVVAGSRNAENIEIASASTGPSVSYRQVNTLDRDALAKLFQEEAPFDILVNSATGGARASGPFLQMDLDAFQLSFRKLWGYTNSVRLGAEFLSNDGAIVLVSGFPARKSNPGSLAISTVGNAVEGFARALAPEIAPRRINIVCPGLIDTPMFPQEGEQRKQFLANATSRTLIPRAGTADEVASAILFAIENDYMTGSTIDIEGGALLP